MRHSAVSKADAPPAMTMIYITIPRLGWSMDEGTFTGWLKSPGEFVSKGDFVFELEGEKAIQEIESFEAGILCVPDDAPKPGDTVRVGQIIGCLLAEGDAPPASLGALSVGTAKSASAETMPRPDGLSSLPVSLTREPLPASCERVAGPAARRLARQFGIDLNRVATPDPTGRVLSEDVMRAHLLRQSGIQEEQLSRLSKLASSPRARRRAREMGIEWQQVPGTGRSGRIRERDVILFAKAVDRRERSAAAETQETKPVTPTGRGDHKPASRFRRTLARRMLEGIHQAAPVTLTTKVNGSKLVMLRKRWKAADAGPQPSYSDILIKLTAIALREQPQLNACWHDNGVWSYQEINIAMAVDTDIGLIAPVICNADELSLNAIADCSQRLIAQAQSGELSQSQLLGGTFTVTNLGMYGVDSFTPILNLPQAAILGIGRIVSEPIVLDDQVVPGETLTLSLTFDHRVTDGAPAARWLKRLSELIETATDILGGPGN